MQARHGCSLHHHYQEANSSLRQMLSQVAVLYYQLSNAEQ